MMKRFAQITLVLCIVSFSGICLAQAKIAVKIDAQNSQDDVIGKRLVYLIRKDIMVSKSLKIAVDENSMLICNILTVKIHGRPSCAYSIIITSNAYGKQSPVLRHLLGVCSNIKVDGAAQGIVGILEENAGKFRSELEKSGGKGSQ